MKDNRDSFRRKDRKVIAENKANRDAQRASASQEEILGGIHDKLDKLDEVQAASEMTSETVENKSNEVISGLNDIQAANELTAEAVENSTGELQKLNDIASQISDKLSQLSTMLENKFSAESPSTGGNASSNSSSSNSLTVISDVIPDIQSDQERITELLDDLLPRIDNAPDADFDDEPSPPEPVRENDNHPAPVSEQGESEEKGKDGKKLSDKIGALLKVTKDGFKTSIGFSDKIASMLFKYTITAAIEAAKTAAMILSLVLAIDVIKTNFKYWSDLFNTNFTEFSKKAGEWEPLLKSIITSVNEVKEAWKNSDWSGLTIAIIKGVGKAIYNLTEMIVLGISKLMAALMREIPGLSDRADAMEADSLKTFQKNTGAKLSDADATLVATADVKRMNEQHKRDGSTPEEREAIDLQRLKYGQLTQSEFDQRKANRTNGNDSAFYNLSEQDQIKSVKARNEADAAIDRVNDYLDNGNADDGNFKKSAEGALQDVKNQLNSDELNKSPGLKAELMGKFNELNKKYQSMNSNKTLVKPESSKESEEVKAVERISSAKQNEASKSPTDGNYTQVNNVNRKTSNVFTLPTQTATVAPGLFGHTNKVN